MAGDEKHSGAANSTLDVLWVLYDRVLNVTPDTSADPARDRFLLSKGHGPASYYAVLAAKGFISPDVLRTFGEFDSPLGHHPDRALINGVEIASGSLGHGLPLAVGVVLALDARAQQGARVFCLVGDAELDEGLQRGDRIRRQGRPGAADGHRDRQPIVDLRLADRHRATLRDRGLEHCRVRRTRSRCDPACSDGATSGPAACRGRARRERLVRAGDRGW